MRAHPTSVAVSLELTTGLDTELSHMDALVGLCLCPGCRDPRRTRQANHSYSSPSVTSSPSSLGIKHGLSKPKALLPCQQHLHLLPALLRGPQLSTQLHTASAGLWLQSREPSHLSTSPVPDLGAKKAQGHLLSDRDSRASSSLKPAMGQHGALAT